MKTHLIMLRCKPQAQFHFGKVALDEDTSLDGTSLIMHADTLFSGLVNVHNKIVGNAKGETDQFVKEFGETIHISSGFYCLEKVGKDAIYFLPKPLAYNLAPHHEKMVGKHKDLKAIEYISVGIWKKGLLAEDLIDESKCVIINKKFACLPDELDLTDYEREKLKIAELNTLPKVKIRKEKEEGGIYYQTNVQLADNGALEWRVHFYFLVRTTEKISPILKTCIQILADTGIGGEKSTGCGHIESVEIKENTASFDFVENKLYASISLVNPNKEETALCFNPVFRGGRRLGQQNSKTYLKQVRMMQEGAIFNQTVKGRVVPLDKNETYLRNGLAFLLPIHQNLNEYVETTKFN